jgi:hypothetical protein
MFSCLVSPIGSTAGALDSVALLVPPAEQIIQTRPNIAIRIA